MTQRQRDSVIPNGREAEFRFSEFEDGLKIDQNALEEACVNQPVLYYEVTKELALGKSRRDLAKKELDEAEARCDLETRHRAEVAGDKIRESEVEAAKVLDAGCKAAREAHMAVVGRLGRLEALKDAYQQRGYVLRDLVQLYMGNYYGDPARGAESAMKDRATETLHRARREQRDTQERQDRPRVART